jgi:hypothetical protein
MASPNVWITRIAARVALGAAFLAPLIALGDELVGPPPPFVGPFAPPSVTEEVMNMMDAPRDYLSGKLVGFVSSVDRFFGDDRNYQETNDSVFQLDTSRVMGYGGERRFVVSARANVHLPIAEQKLHLLIETNPDKNTIIDPKQTQAQAQTNNEPATPQSIGAALRFIKQEAERWHLSADAGIKFQGLSTTPFVRSRASFAVLLDQWRMKPSETAFWFNTIGAGETTQLDFERTVSESVLFRASSVATWLNNTQNFDLRQDFIVFHTLDERAALLYQASVIGVSQPVTHVTDYVLLMQYRYRLHKKWMYFDVSPQLHFPVDRGYRLSPQLNLRLEMMFDEMK